MNGKKFIFALFFITLLSFSQNKFACVWSDVDFPNLELKQAVIGGDLDKVKLLEQQGVDLHQENGNQEGLLHLAAQNGHAHVLRYLILKGLRVNKSSQFSIYPIMRARDPEVVKILVEAGTERYPIEEFAVRSASWECFDFLLSKNLISVDVECERGLTKLQVAVKFGNTELVKKLLARGARDVWGNLSQAALEKGHAEIARLILESEEEHNKIEARS